MATSKLAPRVVAEAIFTIPTAANTYGEIKTRAQLLRHDDNHLTARLLDRNRHTIYAEAPVPDYATAEALFTEWAGVLVRDALDQGTRGSEDYTTDPCGCTRHAEIGWLLDACPTHATEEDDDAA